MKTFPWVVIAGFFLGALVSSSASSQPAKSTVESREEKAGKDAAIGQPKEPPSATPPSPDQSVAKTSVDLPIYKPPLRGSPGGRVGGGTRGEGEEAPVSLCVLAPDHLGLTVQDQPRLYWFVSRPTPYPIELTITERNAVTPLLEQRISPPEQVGIQCFALADYGVRLRQGVQYKWFVVLITDPQRRSRDILAGGMIEYIAAPPSLQTKLDKAGKGRQPYVLAGEGLWYDALAVVSDRIHASPANRALRRQRAALVEQVGLPEIAEYDMKQLVPPQP